MHLPDSVVGFNGSVRQDDLEIELLKELKDVNASPEIRRAPERGPLYFLIQVIFTGGSLQLFLQFAGLFRGLQYADDTHLKTGFQFEYYYKQLSIV